MLYANTWHFRVKLEQQVRIHLERRGQQTSNLRVVEFGRNLAEERINHVDCVVFLEVDLLLLNESFLPLGIQKFDLSFSVGCVRVLDFLASFEVVAAVVAEFVVVFVLGKLDYLLSTLIASKTAYHFVGVVMNSIYSKPVNFGTCSKCLACPEPFRLQLLVVVQKFFHLIQRGYLHVEGIILIDLLLLGDLDDFVDGLQVVCLGRLGLCLHHHDLRPRLHGLSGVVLPHFTCIF